MKFRLLKEIYKEWTWILVGIGVAVLLVTGFGLGPKGFLLGLSVIAFALQAIAFYYFAVALHELGHFIVARKLEFVPYAIKVGPFFWSTPGRKISNDRLKSFAGAVFADITGGANVRRRLIGLVAAGPLVSISVALLLTVVVCNISLIGEQPGFVELFWIPSAWVDAIAAWLLILTLLPNPWGKIPSDGLTLWRLCSNVQKGERLAALTFVGSLLAQDVRWRDLPGDAIEKTCELQDESPTEAQANYFAYGHYQDKHDLDRAKEKLERGLHIVHALGPQGAGLRQLMLIEAANVTESSADGRRLLLEAGDPPTDVKPWFQRAKARIADMEGAEAEAKENLDGFIAYIEEQYATLPNLAASARESVTELTNRYHAEVGTEDNSVG